jgi:hypothetical protein
MALENEMWQQTVRPPPRSLHPCPRERNDDRGGKVGILRLRERMGYFLRRANPLHGHNGGPAAAMLLRSVVGAPIADVQVVDPELPVTWEVLRTR